MINQYFKSVDQIAFGGVLVALVVLGLKYVAYYVTGSIALYSDALESIINVITAVGALIAVRVSAKPADANHPYGHHKAEYFSVVLEGVMIVIASVSIFREAYAGLFAPRIFAAPATGLIVNGLAGVVNGIWCYVLVREGRSRRSAALVADGKHLFTDILSSAAVIVGLLLALLTGWAILDPILGGLVAINILWSGWSLIRSSVGGLMDEAVSDETLEKIRAVIAANAEGALEAHDIRTRTAGRVTFIDFHLVVSGAMPVSEAHAICDRIERALRSDVVDALVTIHVEPEEKAKHRGVLVL
jgi:cation diffusion facilitator family transporter